MEPYIPPNRDKHNQPLAVPFIDLPPAQEDTTPIDKMRQKLKTLEGCRVYAQRKSTFEQVFGILKHVLDFR